MVGYGYLLDVTITNYCQCMIRSEQYSLPVCVGTGYNVLIALWG